MVDGPSPTEVFAAPPRASRSGRARPGGDADRAAEQVRGQEGGHRTVRAAPRVAGPVARSGRSGNPRRVLLILQGMDTCGKDGVIKHVLVGLNPVGLRVASFGRPTRQELEHDFLWRVERQVPAPGMIGAFNRSHYEDVLVPRVHGDFPVTVWARRYDEINGFERRLTEQGVLLIKCFLHISPSVQEKRLLARLDNPKKTWKYDAEDVTERAHWDSYLNAYNDALTACRGPDARWWIIPSDRKWYRNWAVAALLTQRLQDLDPRYPPPPKDIHRERKRIIATRADIRSTTAARRSE